MVCTTTVLTRVVPNGTGRNRASVAATHSHVDGPRSQPRDDELTTNCESTVT